MVDLIKVAKSLREKSNLLARVAAARGARARFTEVREPYAVARPVALHRGPRLEAPAVECGFEYRTLDNPTDTPAYHQTVEVDGSVVSYSHECADWQAAVPLVRPMGRTINPGRAGQITDTVSVAPRPCPVNQRAKPLPLKTWRAKRLAPSMNPGRGAEVREMLITDRPTAQSRPAFTRRHAHVYALHRSAAYVSSLHALRDAILRDVPTFTAEGTRVWGFEVLNCRRHRDDSKMSLGDLFKHHALLSGRLP